MGGSDEDQVALSTPETPMLAKSGTRDPCHCNHRRQRPLHFLPLAVLQRLDTGPLTAVHTEGLEGDRQGKTVNNC